MLFSRTFLTNNLAILVTPLFWRGAGGEATPRFAELVIGSIKASAKNPEQKNYSCYFQGHFYPIILQSLSPLSFGEGPGVRPHCDLRNLSLAALRHPLKTQSKKIIHAIIKDIFNQ
jgi:hypothetical protein